MNYEIKNVIFNINNNYLIMDNREFKILNLLGRGSYGKVHLIEENSKYYIIKISDDNEVKTIKNIFKKNKIINKSYPLYYGKINKINAVGIIYPYLGFYNLRSIKNTNYKINNKQKILIIRDIIEQMKTFNNIVHCDIKSENIVIDIKLDKIISTIVDFGLVKELNEPIFSSSYITSPESLLSCEYKHLLIDNIDNSKHDYYGLFSIIIDLFSDRSMWENFAFYFIHIINIPKYNVDSSINFVYCWYKFYYNSIHELPNESFKKLITIIEKKIINKDNYVSYDIFIDNIGLDNDYIKDFLKKLIHFNPNERPSLDELLNHEFLKI